MRSLRLSIRLVRSHKRLSLSEVFRSVCDTAAAPITSYPRTLALWRALCQLVGDECSPALPQTCSRAGVGRDGGGGGRDEKGTGENARDTVNRSE